MPSFRHPRINDSLGRLKTLATGQDSFLVSPWSNTSPKAETGAATPCPAAKAEAPEKILFLGLGPDFNMAKHRAESLDFFLSDKASPTVFWVEYPLWEHALAQGENPLESPCAAAQDAGWIPLGPEAAAQLLQAEKVCVLIYRQAEQLFPDFWGPVLARLHLAALRPALAATAKHTPEITPEDFSKRATKDENFVSHTKPAVLLPGTPRDLLHLELVEALREEGYDALAPCCFGAHPKSAADGQRGSSLPGNPRSPDLPALARQIEQNQPAFLLSVNLRGLDPHGHIFHLLQAMGVPVALWFVDNPWHILSALRLPWWKQATLFVTDASFIPALHAHGALRVFHLPLGVSTLLGESGSQAQEPYTHKNTAHAFNARLLFVGRSAFPGRHRFFAASGATWNTPPALPSTKAPDPQEKGTDAPEADSAQHFHWWTKKLDLHTLWPGHDARKAGAAAEQSSLALRVAALRDAAALNLAIVGDDGWTPFINTFSPRPTLLPPVDYYTALPKLYRAAPYSLNVTSLLLPEGLTQRHFDVWWTGGFLLSIDNPGMKLFPPELAQPIVWHADQPLAERVAYWDEHPKQKHDMQKEWQIFLGKKHTYQHRIHFLLKTLIKPLDGEQD